MPFERCERHARQPVRPAVGRRCTHGAIRVVEGVARMPRAEHDDADIVGAGERQGIEVAGGARMCQRVGIPAFGHQHQRIQVVRVGQAGIQRERAGKLALGAAQVPVVEEQDPGAGGVCRGEAVVERQRAIDRRARARQRVSDTRLPVEAHRRQYAAECGVRRRELGVGGHRLLEPGQRPRGRVERPLAAQGDALEIQLVGRRRGRSSTWWRGGAGKRLRDGRGHGRRHGVLHVEGVARSPVERLGPHVVPIVHAHELRRDPEAATLAPDAAFDEVRRAERASDTREVLAASGILEGR